MVKKDLHIGILTHNYPRTAGERKDAGIFIYDFATELSKYSKVFVFCPDYGGRKDKYTNVPVTWFNWGVKDKKFGNWFLFNPVSVINFFRLLFIGSSKAIEFAKKNNLNYILSCWSLPSAAFAYFVKLRTGIPYASWSLGSDVNKYAKIPILSQIITLSLREANIRLANSFALIKKVKQISGKDCRFLPAITRFDKKFKKQKNKDNKFHFLFVGRLETVKGPDILINAVKFLLSKRDDFVVDIIGDGSLRGKLENNAKHNMPGKVIFHGWADESLVSQFMSSSDCLIISSRSESLPLVLIEAAKKNLPVVSTKVGDCERLISKYKIGLSVDKENPRLLASAMNEIISLRSKLVKGGFKRFSTDFSLERATKTFLSDIL